MGVLSLEPERLARQVHQTLAMNPQDDKCTEREFDLIMSRSGIVVPDEFRLGALTNYRDLRRQTTLLRLERSPDAAPSFVFSLGPSGINR